MFFPIRKFLAAMAVVLSVALAQTAGSTAGLAQEGASAAGLLKAAMSAARVAGARLAQMRQRACLSLALYHEARGEPVEGQIAVAATIMNRVASRAYPDTICGVVFQNAHRRNACQFSFACDGLPLAPRDMRAFARVDRLAAGILTALDETGRVREAAAGSLVADVFRRLAFVTHYHRYDVHPVWSRRLARIGRIGAHVFLRSERVIRRMPARVRLARLLMQAHGARRFARLSL